MEVNVQEDAAEALVELWHKTDSDMSLQEFLGMENRSFKTFVIEGSVDDGDYVKLLKERQEQFEVVR